jgi:hypothetical protein
MLSGFYRLLRHREPPLGGVAIQSRQHRAAPLDCFVASAPRNDETMAAGRSVVCIISNILH